MSLFGSLGDCSESIKLVNDPWLEGRLKVPCFVLDVNPTVAPTKVSPAGCGFVTAKVARGERFSEDWASNLLSAGFVFVTSEVSFEQPSFEKSQRSEPEFPRVRFATMADEESVVEVARNEFSEDRFHLDRRIPSEIANQIKADWVQSFFRGARGTHLLVWEAADGEVGAFLLLIAMEDCVVVDLVAVRAKFRGVGVGRGLLETGRDLLGGVRRWRVGTQLSNVASVSLYASLGFQPTIGKDVFHFLEM